MEAKKGFSLRQDFNIFLCVLTKAFSFPIQAKKEIVKLEIKVRI